jgi:hypothetical protein
MNNFHDEIKTLLENNEIKRFDQVFYSNENKLKIDESSWDLADLFSTLLVSFGENNEAEEAIKNATLHLCKNYGNPKELFLIYLENCEYYLKNDERFLYFVDLIEILLDRLLIKFVYYSIEMAVNEFLKYIQLVNKKDEINRLIKLLNRLINFVETFANKIIDTDKQATIKSVKNLLTSVLINLFENPFLDLDLESSQELFNIVDRIYLILSKLNKDFFKLIVESENIAKKSNKIEDIEEEEEEENDTKTNSKNPTLMAISSFVYFLSMQLNKNCHFPAVYDPFYLLTFFIPITERLLNEPAIESHLNKGLTTLINFINRIEDASLESTLYEIKEIDQLIQLLFKMMVLSHYESIRKQSNSVFKSLYKKFDRSAHFYFVKYYYNHFKYDETMNNYVSAYLIYLFKEELNECFNNDHDYIVKNKLVLKKIFNLILILKHKVETDLMDESAKIVGILNLLRFILLRDKTNKTDCLDIVKSSPFLDDLEKAIQLSKAHYELEEKNMKSLPKSDIFSNKQNDNKFEVHTVNDNEKINEPSVDDKIKSVQLALQTFDLIESLRVRINEIITERQNDK